MSDDAAVVGPDGALYAWRDGRWWPLPLDAANALLPTDDIWLQMLEDVPAESMPVFEVQPAGRHLLISNSGGPLDLSINGSETIELEREGETRGRFSLRNHAIQSVGVRSRNQENKAKVQIIVLRRVS